VKDYVEGEYVIPAGSDLCVSVYLTHRNKSIYSEPDRFVCCFCDVLLFISAFDI
jgi:cytochrome P450